MLLGCCPCSMFCNVYHDPECFFYYFFFCCFFQGLFNPEVRYSLRVILSVILGFFTGYSGSGWEKKTQNCSRIFQKGRMAWLSPAAVGWHCVWGGLG